MRTFLSAVLFLVSVSASARAEDRLFMCEPGELLFSDDFDPATVSERWWYKGEFALRDGALGRTEVNAEENQRVFLKDPEFHNTIVEFDFKLEGDTTDLRLVTGSGGHYNSIIQIRPGHFQVNTPVDRAAGLVPSHVGECAFKIEKGKWHTMTVEYFGEEIVAHLDGEHFITGSHPIIDHTRAYFAFQFDRPSAAIDNVRVRAAKGQRDDWPKRRKELTSKQSNRPAVERNPDDLYRYVFTNVQSRLSLSNSEYRDLVKCHADLQEALHVNYPEAFRTHKELSKSIRETKQKLKTEDPEFKPMESEMHKARRAEDDYVVSRFPKLKELPKHRFQSELALSRAKLEKASDKELASLVAESERRQVQLEAKFPDAFSDVEILVEKRNAIRKALNDDPEFQKRNREVADAWQGIKQYELNAEPRLVELEAARKAFVKKN